MITKTQLTWYDSYETAEWDIRDTTHCVDKKKKKNVANIITGHVQKKRNIRGVKYMTLILNMVANIYVTGESVIVL